MYTGRDNRLTRHFSENFSGYTGGGEFLVKDRLAWEKITFQDFAQAPGQLRSELLEQLQDQVHQLAFLIR